MDNNKTLDSQLSDLLEEIAYSDLDDKDIYLIDEDQFRIKDQVYYVVESYRQGFDFDSFKHRYQEYFEKFDYIVGDWASNMLRLRGFYQLNQARVPKDQTIGFLDDYLKEYCNFGAAYFVVAKAEALATYQTLRSKEEVKAVSADLNANNYVTTPSKSPNRRKKRRKKTNYDKPAKRGGQMPRQFKQKQADNQAENKLKAKEMASGAASGKAQTHKRKNFTIKTKSD